MEEIGKLLCGIAIGAGIATRSALATAPFMIPAVGILVWTKSDPRGFRHKIEHSLGVNLGGLVMSYMGKDQRIHQGLFCDICGSMLSGKVEPASPKLGEIMDKSSANSMISRMSRHGRNPREDYEQLAGAHNLAAAPDGFWADQAKA